MSGGPGRLTLSYAAIALCRLQELAELGRHVGGAAVVDALEPASREIVDHGARLALFDVLLNQSDLMARIALVAIAEDGLAIEQLAHRLDVIFGALIGAEASSAPQNIFPLCA